MQRRKAYLLHGVQRAVHSTSYEIALPKKSNLIMPLGYQFIGKQERGTFNNSMQMHSAKYKMRAV